MIVNSEAHEGTDGMNEQPPPHLLSRHSNIVQMTATNETILGFTKDIYTNPQTHIKGIKALAE